MDRLDADRSGAMPPFRRRLTSVSRSVRTLPRRVVTYLARAARGTSRERHDVEVVVKTILATVAAWVLARALLHPDVTTFAAFAALVSVRGTAYRSVTESVQYMLAVAVALSLAALFGVTVGVAVWSLTVLLLIALGASRLRLLGDQRAYVPTVALFAFISGGGQPGYIGNLLIAIGIGVTAGTAIDVVLARSLSYSDSRDAVAGLSTRLCRLLDEMSGGLAEGEPSVQAARSWLDRAERIRGDVGRARGAVEDDEEARRLNPRRVLAHAEVSFPGYHAAVSALARAGEQAAAIAGGLYYATRSEQSADDDPDFRAAYADLLEALAAVTRHFGRPGDAGESPDSALRQSLEDARSQLAALTERGRTGGLDSPENWPVYGQLLTDAGRFIDELDGARTEAVVPADAPPGLARDGHRGRHSQ
jgi:hypothetical protein